MHIAIEGLDGVGKTSTAKVLAERLGYRFVEKPMQFFTDNGDGIEQYTRATDWLNSSAPNKLKAYFYGCGNVFTASQFKGKNIITDRHLASNYYWNGDEENEVFFETLVKEAGAPDMTVILYANPDVRKERIISRDPNDKDIDKLGTIKPEAYDRIKNFVTKFSMPYVFIDNSNMNLEQTVESILASIKGCAL